MQKLIQKTAVASTAILTVVANAHPGHDHAAATSSLTHLFFYGAIVAVVAATAFVAVKAFNK